MRLAVFTSQYPAPTSTFFQRDMRALLEAGIDIDVFPIYPLRRQYWKYSLELLDEQRLPRHRVHHLELAGCLRGLRHAAARAGTTAWPDAATALTSSMRYGPAAVAKTAYVFPKAWNWAEDFRGRFDHVLAYWGNYAGTCAWAFHRLLDEPIPFSIWLHAGTDLYRTPIRLKQKLDYADNVITCCEFNRGYILDHFAADRDALDAKLHICHHGLDLEAFPHRLDGRPERQVIAVGRMATHKGFDILVRAVHLLYSRGVDVDLDLVGDGPERRSLESLVASLGIERLVRFRGWLPFPEARQAMSEATVLVHPSDGLGDGLPNVVREAMALGTPVIGSAVAGIPDAIGDGCGELVAPKDVVALAAAIERMVTDPALRRDVATRARHRVEQHYDLWRNGARLAQRLRDTRRRGRSEHNRGWVVAEPATEGV